MSCVATKDGKAALTLHQGFFFWVYISSFTKFTVVIQTMKYYFNDDVFSIDPAYFRYIEPMQVFDLT